MSYQIAKGVFDILPKDPDPEGKWRESFLWNYVETVAKKIANNYCFKEIRTPIFEKTALFERSIGNETDIVSKEMYTFEDKGGRLLSLRPEGTAPVMRAFIEKKLNNLSSTHKFFYLIPMFRYERQQAGRYRQHHQFGVEAIGNQSPFQDVECIELLYTFLDRLGIKNCVLRLNSIGDKETRLNYREALKKYLTPYLSELSEESRIRFDVNPLRILDSKNLNDKAILEKAPSILEFLDPASQVHFREVCTKLKEIGIEYIIDNQLVRGLDYYNRTVFEITSDALGAQNSLGGGGRYDGLIQELGGPDLPAFGFGAGIERIIQTMLAQKVCLPPYPHPMVYFIALGEEAARFSFKLISELRREDIACEMDFSQKKLKLAMRNADQVNARFTIVMGDQEISTKVIEIKEMKTGKTFQVPLDEIKKWLHTRERTTTDN